MPIVSPSRFTTPTAAPRFNPVRRVRFLYAVIIVIACVFVVRLFYLQIIRHDYYQKAALQSQLKQYEIPAARGVISAYDGDKIVPLVMNETLYTLFADPKYITQPKVTAQEIQKVIGGNADEYEKLIHTPDTRYVVLAKKLSREKAEAITKLDLKGVGTREAQYRTYPDGQLAAQVIGFVNEEGDGKYGLEQAYDKALRGQPGELKAITDVRGVPLPANADNTVRNPVAGTQLVLTLDVGMQQQTEDILKTMVEQTKAASGSAVIMDATTGAVKAMANYPTYNPAEYFNVQNLGVFTNPAVDAPLEVGSIMKVLTTAAGLDLGVVYEGQTYFDPSFFKVDGATIKNVEEDGGAGTKSIADILQLSLNTGATWLLMQMGGGEINAKARTTWHGYMTDHYQFGKPTGIELGYEDPGYIPEPNEGFGLNITYANTAFGQGMTATPLQMLAAFGSVVNGGTYYRPHLIDKEVAADGAARVKQPEVVRADVIKPAVSEYINSVLEYTFQKNHKVYGPEPLRPEYRMGGKTGTAQIAKPEGGYYDDRYTGTYLGFVGGNAPQYVIAVKISEPKVPGYAGAKAAAPTYVKLANMLIDNFGVSPKR